MKNNVLGVVTLTILTNLLIACRNENSNNKDEKKSISNLSITGKWYDSKDSSNTMELKLIDNTLVEGTSCFIFQDGDRIDCSETNNIFLTKERDNSYSGNFYSDYISDTLRVKVIINNTLELIFIDPYDFGDHITFHK